MLCVAVPCWSLTSPSSRALVHYILVGHCTYVEINYSRPMRITSEEEESQSRASEWSDFGACVRVRACRSEGGEARPTTEQLELDCFYWMDQKQYWTQIAYVSISVYASTPNQHLPTFLDHHGSHRIR